MATGIDRSAMEGLRCTERHATTLRLFSEPSAADSAAALSPQMTLAEFFREYFLPVCLVARGAAPRNVQQYRESIAYWRKFTLDPPLALIDDFTCAQFVRELAQVTGLKKGATLSPNTIRKHCFHAQTVLDAAGPKSRHNRKGTGLLPDVPWIERPRQRKKDVTEVFTLDEIARILTACAAAKAPQQRRTGVEPAQWWRSLFEFDYNTGMRIGTLGALEYAWLRHDEQYASMVMDIPPGRAYKRGDAHKIPLNAAAVAAVERIRTDRVRIFPWPHTESWLHETRRRILRQAGLPRERQFGFHGVRRLYGTKMARINPIAGRKSLGHSNPKTFEDCYVGSSLWTEALDELPQPTP